MTARDPQTCRRALREIGEVAAVAVMPDSQMTDKEALQTIAAIAEWVLDEAPASSADCGDVIQTLHRLTDAVQFDDLDDRDAVGLFSQVLNVLETSGSRAFAIPSTERVSSIHQARWAPVPATQPWRRGP